MDKTRWGLLSAYAAVSACNQLLWLTFAPITTGSAERYGVGVDDIGLLSEVFPLLYVLLAIPAGIALDRRFRGCLLLGAALTAAGGLIRLTTDSYEAVLAGQVVVALAQPLVASALTKAATTWSRPQDRPLAIALGSAGLSAGLLTALVSGGIAGADDLRPLLVLQAALAVAAGTWLALALRRDDTPVAAVAAGAGRQALRTVWAEPVVRRMTGLVVVGFGVFVALTTYLEPLLEPEGTTSGQAAALLVALVLAGVLGSLTIPPLVSRRDQQRTALVAALVVTAAGCALLAVVHSEVGVGVVLVAMGFLLLATLPVVFELVERRAGDASATAASLLWMAGNAGGLVVAVTVGAVVDSPALAFGLLAVTALLGLPFLRKAPVSA